MKTVLFVPGFMEGLDDRDYNSVLKVIQSKGYATKFVSLNWKYKAIDDWVLEFNETYKKYNPSETILAGFSYGAMVILVAASHRAPSQLWLFSLSPYFSEDIPYLKHWWMRMIGKERMERFWRLSFDKIYPKISCPVKLFVGSDEYTMTKNRFKDAGKKLKICESFEVRDTKHEIDNPNYIDAIKENV